MPELPLVGDEFAGYRLRAVLGRGGMSTVYQAENPRLGNVIALKVLAPELATDDVFRTRFLEESRIAAAMNHPHVIPIHDMGSTDGLLYIAMRCVSGTDLRQMISKRGRLLPDTAIFLLSQAARALDAAHRRGLVHRDVKPGNLLAERGNDDSDPDHLYLADFGITKPAIGRTGLTATGAFLGTIDYVAPEQIRGLSVLGMADQYSLGCVLYECLTGRVPFEKDLDAAIIWAHVEEPPTRLTLLRPDLPPAIDEVFARVLAKQPGDRYENCREFVGAARQALGIADAPAAANAPGGLSRRVLRPAPPVADYQEVAHDPHGARDQRDSRDAHDVHTGLRVMTPSIARPTSLPQDNLPAWPALAPVPEWSPPYLPGGLPPGGSPGLGGPGRPTSADDPGGPDDPAGSGDNSDNSGRATAGRPARDRGERRLPVLLLALAFALTAGIGITLGSWLGFPGQAASGQRPGAGSPAAAAGSASAAAAVRTPATGASLTPPTLPATPPKTLRQALAMLNATVWTTGFLPPKSCTFASAVSARCSDPYPGITDGVLPELQLARRSLPGLRGSDQAGQQRAFRGQHAGLRRVGATGERRGDLLEPLRPAHPGVFDPATGNGQAERGEPGRRPDVLQLQQHHQHREHHLDPDRWQPAGRGNRITAPGRVELVASRAPQHRLQRAADGRHEHGAVRLPEGLGGSRRHTLAPARGKPGNSD